MGGACLSAARGRYQQQESLVGHGQRAASAGESRAQTESALTKNPFTGQDSARILRLKQVAAIVGLGKSSIYRKVQEKTFPAPIKLGSARASGWISTEVFEWIDDQIRRSRKG